MKIGLSLNLCVEDIFQGLVDADDVLVIITSTHLETLDDMNAAIDYYMRHGRFTGTIDQKDDYMKVITNLWNSGKFHQPRQYGVSRGPTPVGHHWLDVTPAGVSTDPNVLEAWRNYQLMLKLVK